MNAKTKDDIELYITVAMVLIVIGFLVFMFTIRFMYYDEPLGPLLDEAHNRPWEAKP